MNFDFSEEQQAIRDLTAQIVGDKVDHARLRELTAAGERVDRPLWVALGDAGVLGASLPEAHGGAGLGFVATAAALEVIGEHAALAPMLTTVVGGALAVAEFGSGAQKERLLPAVVRGEHLMAAALVESPAPVNATLGQGAWTLSGMLPNVPGGLDADTLLVPAGGQMFLVDTASAAVERTAQPTTSGQPDALITLTDVPAEVLGGFGGVAAFIALRFDAGICSTMAGLCQGALDLTADYVKQRKQFDRVIASFQAVSQRAADSFIDTEAIRLTSRQAAWRIEAGLSADDEVAIARYWAAEGGFRVVHAATHLHGGVGVDRDYPLHRHFLAARQLELLLGNAEMQLEKIGSAIAAD